ncbi:MAG: polysaccharide biosynthesis protein [Myxococcales bacterium]|nr:polysaccharide biosynthesis protein [Myxococcales bacterium]
MTTASKPAAATSPARDAAHAARGGLMQLLGAIAQMLMPVYQVTAARLFGQATFGIYQTSLVAFDLCVRLGWMGGDRAMHRFIASHVAAGEDELAQRAFGGQLRLTAGVSTVLAVALALSSGLIARLTGKPALGQMLPIMSIMVVPATATMILVAATLGKKTTRVNFLVRALGEPIFMILAAVIAWKLSGSPRSLAIAHVSASTIGCVGAFVGACFVFGGAWVRRALRAPTHPKLLAFALPVAGAEVGNTILQKADLFILSFFVPDRAIAVYAAAEFLGRIAANVRYAFDGIAAPVLAEALHLGDRERLRYNLALMTRWVATLSVPLAVTMVGLRADLLALYGPGFVTGTTLVCIWTTTHLVSGTLGLMGHVLTMSGRSRTYLVNQTIAGALNVGLSLLLIPRFGMTGAAVSALVAVTTPLTLALFEVWSLERVHPFEPGLAKPFVAGAAMLAVEIAVGRIVTGHLAHAAAAVGSGLVVYLVTLGLLRPGREERELVGRLLARIRRGRV